MYMEPEGSMGKDPCSSTAPRWSNRFPAQPYRAVLFRVVSPVRDSPEYCHGAVKTGSSVRW